MEHGGQREDSVVIVGGQGGVTLKARLEVIVRGLIKDGRRVKKGVKIGGIDPRDTEFENGVTVSDKARCIAGAVLEGLLYLEARQEL